MKALPIALVLLATACGSSPPPAGPAVSSKAVAYSRCMRAHGVPDFPDPARGGGAPKVTPQQAGVSNAAGQCTHLLVPPGAGPTTIQLCDGIGEDGGCGGYGDPPR